MSLFTTHNHVMRRLIGHIAPGGPPSDDKWKEKAVKSLVKRLKKTNQLDVLEQAISCRNSSTLCVTIPRSQDGRLQIGPKKGWPHVFYCQLWRWPDLYSQHELRPVPSCQYAFHKKAAEVCVNPYHYTRIQNPSIMVPHYLPSGRGRPSNMGLNESSSGSGRLRVGEAGSDLSIPVLPLEPNTFRIGSGSKNTERGSSSGTSTSGSGEMPPNNSTLFNNSSDAATHSPHSVSTLVGLSPGVPNCAQLSLSERTRSPSPAGGVNNMSGSSTCKVSIKEEVTSPTSNHYSSMTDSGDGDTHPRSSHEDDDLMDLLYDDDIKLSVSDKQSIASSSVRPDFLSSSSHDRLAETNSSSGVKFTSVEYCAMDEWCRVYYFEYNSRVGDIFHCSSPHLTVDGYTNPNKSNRFCLGVLTNVTRELEADNIRRHIGRGLTLFYLGGEVLVECNGDNAIFVQSPNCNYMNGWHLATVIKVPPACNLTIFNNEVFASLLNRYVNLNYESVYELAKMCIIRISFVKGWGASYKRDSITCTPCWIEVHLNGPLQWLDRVLQQMGSSTMTCSSIS